MKKRPVLIAVVVLAAAGVAALAWPRAVVVDLLVVDRGTVVESIEEEGRTRLRDRVVVTAPVAGLLARPALRAGDLVKAGDVVARIAPPPAPLVGAADRAGLAAAVRTADAGVAQAGAALERARAAREAASAQLQRIEKLVATGGAPAVQLDDAKAALHAIDHEVEAAGFAGEVARHQAALARASQQRVQQGTEGDPPLSITAPIDGVVLAVHVDQPGVVGPGTPLLEIGDPRTIEVVVPLLSDDTVRLPAGAAATLSGWGGADLRGRLLRIEPRATTRLSALGVEETRVATVVRLDGQAPAGLGDGFRVRVALELWRDDVVRVPLAGLVRRGEGWGAWVVVDGRAAWRPVRAGHRGGAFAEVKDGLQPGDVIVGWPGERVGEGQRVQARGDAP